MTYKIKILLAREHLSKRLLSVKQPWASARLTKSSWVKLFYCILQEKKHIVTEKNLFSRQSYLLVFRKTSRSMFSKLTLAKWRERSSCFLKSMNSGICYQKITPFRTKDYGSINEVVLVKEIAWFPGLFKKISLAVFQNLTK